MKLMEGKRGVIFGVSNTHGIAYGIAKQLYDAGAEIAFTYAGEVMEKRVRPIAEGMNAKVIMSCDVTKEDEVKAVFAELEKVYGKIDFVVHAVAFAQREDLMGEFINTSKEGWDIAMGVSSYSLVSLARNARHGSFFTYEGKKNIKNKQFERDNSPLDEKCDCYACQNHSKAYIRHLYRMGEANAQMLLSIHNTRFLIKFIHDMRDSILEDRFEEFYNQFVGKV